MWNLAGSLINMPYLAGRHCLYLCHHTMPPDRRLWPGNVWACKSQHNMTVWHSIIRHTAWHLTTDCQLPQHWLPGTSALTVITESNIASSGRLKAPHHWLLSPGRLPGTSPLTARHLSTDCHAPQHWLPDTLPLTARHVTTDCQTHYHWLPDTWPLTVIT